MAPDDDPRTAFLRVAITDAMGRPLRRPALCAWLQAVAPARARGDVTVALVSDAFIRRLNRRYARTDRATDVLSFPPGASPAPGPAAASSTRARGRAPLSGGRRHLGDIVIAVGIARRQARRAGHSMDTELRVLALHGLLHLLGYDHATDKGAMAAVERRLRRKGGLEEGLIDRASATEQAGRTPRGQGRAPRARRRGRLAASGRPPR